MATTPKKTGPKKPGQKNAATTVSAIKAVKSPVVRTAAAKPVAKTNAVALTAAQALKAVDQAIGTTPSTKRAYIRKAPTAPVVAEPIAAKQSAPKPAAIATPAPASPAPASPVAKPEPVRSAPVAKVTAPVISPVPVEQNKPEENAAPEAVAPAIPTLAASAEGNVMMNDVIENTKKYTEDAKARFQSAFSDMSGKAKAGVEKSTKAMEEMSDIAKGNVEALVESGKIAAKGFETMGQDAAEYGRLSFEKATATMKSLAAVKSPTEFFQLQSELMSTAFDGFAKEAAKNSEAFMKLAGEVAQPISSRVSLVTDKVKSLAA